MRHRRVTLPLTAVALAGWVWFIFRNSLKSKPQSAAQSESLSRLLERILCFFGLDAISDNAVTIVRKCAHIFEFFVLALLIFILMRLLFASVNTSLAVSASGAFIAAATDEILQIFSHRGPSVRDVLIDGIGIAMALLCCYLKSRKPKMA